MLRIALITLGILRACSGDIYVDLGREVNEESAFWPNSRPYEKETSIYGYSDKGYWYESYTFCMAEHTGTHLDAPSHFAKDRWTVSDIPLEHLMGAGVVVDIRDKVKDDPVAELTAGDLMAWMDEHGPLPDSAIVFVHTGWGTRYGNKTAYFGTDSNDTSNLIFPGINSGASQLLAGYERASGHRIFGVGIDTPSTDHGPSQLFPTHVELSKANIYGLENVANLEKLPTTGFSVMVMPLKVTKGSGAPTRILATVPGDATNTASPCPGTTLCLFLPVLIFQIVAKKFELH